MSYYSRNRTKQLKKAKEYREANRERINDNLLRRYYLYKTSGNINGYNGKNPERTVDNVLKNGKLGIHLPPKHEMVDWIFWFYKGSYPKSSIIEHNNISETYFLLKHGGGKNLHDLDKDRRKNVK